MEYNRCIYSDLRFYFIFWNCQLVMVFLKVCVAIFTDFLGVNCSVIFESRDKEINFFLVLEIALVILTVKTTLLVTCKFTKHGGVVVRQVQIKRNLQGVRKHLISHKSQQLLHRQILNMCSVKSLGGDSKYTLSFVLIILLLFFLS